MTTLYTTMHFFRMIVRGIYVEITVTRKNTTGALIFGTNAGGGWYTTENRAQLFRFIRANVRNRAILEGMKG